MVRSTLAAFALSLTLLATGCATYVNIPPHPGDVAVHNPNEENVQNVMVAAARAALAERSIDGPFQVVLPPGTLPTTYDAVLPRIHSKATWSPDGPREGQATVEIRELRIRGSSAEVDVIRPWDPKEPAGYQQLLTVELSWDPAAKWQADRVVGWRTSVDRALQTKSYAAPPEISR
jgi:hypothetical protein